MGKSPVRALCFIANIGISMIKQIVSLFFLLVMVAGIL